MFKPLVAIKTSPNSPTPSFLHRRDRDRDQHHPAYGAINGSDTSVRGHHAGTPVYDKFANKGILTSAQDGIESNQRPRQQVAAGPGGGPERGVSEHYVGVTDDGSSSYEHDHYQDEDGHRNSTSSYVMRPINGETSEEAGSGNMIVNRLLEDLKLHGGSDEMNEQVANVGGQVETQAVVDKPAAMPISSLPTTQRTPITPTTARDNVLTNTHADADVSAEESFVDAGLAEDLLDGEDQPHGHHTDQHDGQAYDAGSDVASEALKRATSRSERGVARSASVASGPRTNKAAFLRQGITTDHSIPSREIVPIDFAQTPGHKREGLQVVVPSLAKPSIAPRSNRATLIRTGQLTPSSAPPNLHSRLPNASSPSTPLSVSRGQGTSSDPFANTPGHKRVGVSAKPKSIETPKMAVRATKASLLRTAGGVASPGRDSSPAVMSRNSFIRVVTAASNARDARSAAAGDDGPISSRGGSAATPRNEPASSLRNCSTAASVTDSSLDVMRTTSSTPTSHRIAQALSPEQIAERNKRMFEGVPGHRRRESLHVASTAGPTVTPRLNRAAVLRQDPSAAQPSPSAVHSGAVFRARPLPAFYGGGGGGSQTTPTSEQHHNRTSVIAKVKALSHDETETF